ncbi:protein RSI-1-like [Benincasa hispida]|uniref:protein RSI-1-like n=1 Tax=Benincasa hispida TaxID=102211 RepID=UPI001901C829|nr:protein RSI-1-like [Benincasa hispida]
MTHKMASSRPYIITSFFILFFLTSSLHLAEAASNLRPSDCKPKCNYRCSATSHRKPCMFFCQKCCAKCLCVPPGTYGNKQVCPCYNNWKTQQGGPKCP